MKLSKYIDHTNLKVNAQKSDILRLCNEAIEYDFAAVCVHPYYVRCCKEILVDTKIKVCTVIGFPLGQNTTDTKIFETKEAINNGADEIDMVINIAALKDQKYDYIKNEINEILKVCNGKLLKVIIETCYLNNDEIIKMTEICNETSTNFIKTSTGFGTRGASIEDIMIINKSKNKNLEIKASGGIKTIDDTLNYINLGVSRIGTSSGVEILNSKLNNN